MKIGPKYKIARRLGAPIFEKTQTEKFATREARNAKNRRRRRGNRSNYAIQLNEKQKARYSYGISENQFSRYVKDALEKKGDTKNALYERLEMRLDNVVYRSGLAKTSQMARQLVVHGHFTVNGKRLNVPSHKLKVGDEVAVRTGSKEKTAFQPVKDGKDTKSVPAWLAFDPKKMAVKVSKVPTYDKAEHVFDLTSVIEFYSR